MKSFRLIASLQMPRANLTFENLLDFAHAANTGLIEHLRVQPDDDERSLVSFRLKHLFREFGVPQVEGELTFVKRGMHEEDGVGCEYSALLPGEDAMSEVRHLSICMPGSVPGVAVVRYRADVPDEMPNMVLHAAERVFRQAVVRTEAMIASMVKDNGLQTSQEPAVCPEAAALSDEHTPPWI